MTGKPSDPQDDPSRDGTSRQGVVPDSYIDKAGRRRPRHQLSEEQRHRRDAEIVRLRRSGVSFRDIQRVVGCGRSTIARAIENAPSPNLVIHGKRVGAHRKACVTVEGEPLKWQEAPDFLKRNATGPEWGYTGNGPHLLAYVLLALVTNKDEDLRQHVRFRDDCIARIVRYSEWTLTTHEIHDWLLRRRTDSSAGKLNVRYLGRPGSVVPVR